jgi:hypothetical protein
MVGAGADVMLWCTGWGDREGQDLKDLKQEDILLEYLNIYKVMQVHWNIVLTRLSAVTCFRGQGSVT